MAAKESSNGNVDTELEDPTEAQRLTPGVKTGPRMMRRELWAKLPGDYQEFEFRFWVNHPVEIMTRVKYTIGVEQKEALCQIVLEHNGWRDFDGNEYPPANEPAFWDAIPDEVAAAILATVETEKDRLPNSARTMRRR